MRKPTEKEKQILRDLDAYDASLIERAIARALKYLVEEHIGRDAGKK